MEIDVRVDIKKATQYLKHYEKQVIPVATAKALTFVAERSQKKIKRLIPQVFSNPTPFTRNAVRKAPANRYRLKSSVFLKDTSLARDHYLLVNTDLRISAVRQKTRTEKRLDGGYWVQGKDAKTNKYGNLTRGTYTKMLADVGRLGLFTGDAANTTRKKKQYFIIGHSPNRMIMKRINKHRTVPWLVEVAKVPKYSRRLRMNQTTQITIKQQFRRLFDKQVKRETAKLRP